MRPFVAAGALAVAAAGLTEPVDPCWAVIEWDDKYVPTDFPVDSSDADLDALAASFSMEHDVGRFEGARCNDPDDLTCVPRTIREFLREKRDACAAYREPRRAAREAEIEAARDPCDNAADYGTPRRRVALAFWGVNRALGLTFASIQERIFRPLERLCVRYDVFVATHAIDEIHNPRAGEYRIDARGGWRDLLDALRPVAWSVTRQRDFLDTIDVADWLVEGAGDERRGLGNLTFQSLFRRFFLS